MLAGPEPAGHSVGHAIESAPAPRVGGARTASDPWETLGAAFPFEPCLPTLARRFVPWLYSGSFSQPAGRWLPCQQQWRW